MWATDLTYIPLRKDFLYLLAVMDLFSRHVLSWDLSNSLGTEFCILLLRLWRTHKDEEMYLLAYSDGWEAEIRLARFIWRYDHVSPHSELNGKTPHQVYTETNPVSPV